MKDLSIPESEPASGSRLGNTSQGDLPFYFLFLINERTLTI